MANFNTYYVKPSAADPTKGKVKVTDPGGTSGPVFPNLLPIEVAWDIAFALITAARDRAGSAAGPGADAMAAAARDTDPD